MNTRSFSLLLLMQVTLFISGYAQPDTWKMVDGKIKSQWAAKVDPANPLAEYPRPQMIRPGWQNLNGLWQYAITPKATAATSPTAFEGNILVPFAVESALSGVGRTVGKDSILWYKKTITLSSKLKNQAVLLHFGAVDWECDVFVNGQKAGSHQGGYDPFSFDITSLLAKGDQQEIMVKVWDPSNDGPQPRGKQIKNPHGIWYTPVTGIWQTVWTETVPTSYIVATKNTPDLDQSNVTISATTQNLQPGDMLRIRAWDGTTMVSEKEVTPTEAATLPVPNAKKWAPGSPFLYELTVGIIRKGKVVDEVKGYFAMRKISVETDAQGIQRMMLNNSFVFQYGPLDQGWWPDGLYTAPTDEALLFDIEKTRDMGFNMIRKHVKVEPARWYYHCDKLGMLVWQDMPSGDMGNRWESRPGVSGLGTEKERTPESEAIFRKEWKAIMDANYNFPSIVMWVPFNEAWGQFKTGEITEWTMKYDPSRLVNSASGGNFFPVGHIMDLHNYPAPAMPTPELFGQTQVIVLGEFGGLGLPVTGHTWQQKDNWGYQTFKTNEELLDRYKTFMESLTGLISKGLSAAIYTQTTDVEVETNGLMTYDREVIKMPVSELFESHKKLYNPSLVRMK
ncbi:glycoside hydrolase family 2 protein [Arundinibacter roseus]|uniref:Beta-galactosidase n=1 Tax=Arundinibacter roseus TaxID=2070510 RepID=A0A4R4KDH0_9BACT|nr:sugar-binding domain-containing protein [Arundinibacter roseus]TDB65974.1 beta-galactosidase [Arundinibacter roseus]